MSAAEPLAGEPASASTVRKLHGREVKLSDFRGKVVILDFWASWCPMLKGVPDFIELYKEYKDEGVAVVDISAACNNGDVVQSFVKKHQVSYPTLMMNRKVRQAYGRNGRNSRNICLEENRFTI